jgi:hypothetical protein
MNSATIAALLLAVALFAYVFAPVRHLIRGERKSRLQYLQERKEQLYDNLRDLNFEFKAGKFPEADYNAMRLSLENEAATILAEMDAISKPSVATR